MTTNLTYDNPFWVGPLPEPLLYPSIHHSTPHNASKPKRPKPRPSLDPSPDNPFLNSDNPFIANSSGEMSGSGSEALLRSFKESQTKSKMKERKMQIKKEGKVDEGSPVSSIGGMDLEHIAINRDLKPSQDQILSIQERVGGSSMPPEARPEEDETRGINEEEVEIKAEDIRAEMSKKVNKAGKRKSTGMTTAGVEEEGGRVMTRGKKARLSEAAAKQEEEALPLGEMVMVDGRSRLPWGEDIGPSTMTGEVPCNGISYPSNWRTARSSLPGPSTAGPSNSDVRSSLPGPSISQGRSSLAGPSTRPIDAELEREVMDGIYSNMLDTITNDTSTNATSMNTTMDDTSLNESAIKGKGKGKSKAAAKGKGKEVPPAGEVRSGRWRKKCPKSTLERLDRVMHQRMFMLDRTDRLGLIETFKVLGSTGNVYTIQIGPTPTCDCPDAGKGNIPCKHIIFIFIKVLKVPPSSEYWYQKRLLDSELQNIYSFAPPAAHDQVLDKARTAYLKATGAISDDAKESKESVEDTSNGKRKDAVGEDCPVCYEEMTDDDLKGNLLVWDESDLGCGKALHQECFRNWTISLKSKGTEISCVWCRCPWPIAGKSGMGGGGGGVQYTQGGYMNIADLAGVSRVRDTSSYYHGPIRGRRMDEPRYEDD